MIFIVIAGTCIVVTIVLYPLAYLPKVLSNEYLTNLLILSSHTIIVGLTTIACYYIGKAIQRCIPIIAKILPI